MADYKMIPVDTQTYNRILELCDAYDMGKRAQGTLVRKLVKADYEKWAAVKLAGKVESVNAGTAVEIKTKKK